MKKVMIMLFMQLSIFAYGQTTGTAKSIKDYAFSRPLNTNAKISQRSKDGAIIRQLTPFVAVKGDPAKLYLLNEYNRSSGSLLASQYIVSKAGIPTSFNLFFIPINSLCIFYYDAVFISRTYGSTSGAIGNMVVKNASKVLEVNTATDNPVILCNQDGNFCIDWYWQTYINGVLAAEEYLYTTCQPCGGGGGGGVPPISGCPNVEFMPISMLQSVTSVQSGAISRTMIYKWTICKQLVGLWSFVSFERGVHNKVGDVWEWSSLNHESISKQGFEALATIDCSLNYANPTIGKYLSTMEIDFSIKSTYSCALGTFSFTKSGNSIGIFSSQYKLGFPLATVYTN